MTAPPRLVGPRCETIAGFKLFHVKWDHLGYWNPVCISEPSCSTINPNSQNQKCTSPLTPRSHCKPMVLISYCTSLEASMKVLCHDQNILTARPASPPITTEGLWEAQPSHPLPCPWSRAQHIPNPSPHARACSHALRLPSCTTRRPQSLLIKRQVSILPAERWLVKARARHRPQRPVSEINLSLFLFQSSSLQLLASLAMNLPEFVRQCWPTQPGAVLSSRPSPLGIPRTELLTRERTRASVRFLN